MGNKPAALSRHFPVTECQIDEIFCLSGSFEDEIIGTLKFCTLLVLLSFVHISKCLGTVASRKEPVAFFSSKDVETV